MNFGATQFLHIRDSLLGDRHHEVGWAIETLPSPVCLTHEPLHTAGALPHPILQPVVHAGHHQAPPVVTVNVVHVNIHVVVVIV